MSANAQSNTQTEENPISQWVTYSLADETYGINVMQVQEVLKMDDEITQPKLSKSSVDKLLRYVKGLLNWAKENDYVKESPADALKLKNPGSQDEQRDAIADMG